MEQTRQRGEHKLYQRILLDAGRLWEDKIHVQVSKKQVYCSWCCLVASVAARKCVLFVDNGSCWYVIVTCTAPPLHWMSHATSHLAAWSTSATIYNCCVHPRARCNPSFSCILAVLHSSSCTFLAYHEHPVSYHVCQLPASTHESSLHILLSSSCGAVELHIIIQYKLQDACRLLVGNNKLALLQVR